MKLTSLEFTLYIATLCVIAGGAYCLGQRHADPDVVLLPTGAPTAPSALLMDDAPVRHLADLDVHESQRSFSARTRDTSEWANGSDAIMRTAVTSADFRVTRVRVLETYGEISLVQETDRGAHFNRVGYVHTGKLRSENSGLPFTPPSR